MSYILEALKKADQERALGSVPDLDTPHWGIRRSARNYRWIWIVAVLLLVNGVLLAFLLGRGTGDEEPLAGAPTINSQAPEPVVPVTPLPGGGTTVVDRPRSMIQPLQTRQRLSVPSTPVQKPLVTQAAVPETSPESAAQPVPVVVPQPVQVQSRQSGVQLWDDLSLEFRSTFPLPHIDVHVYAEKPARRFILVDLQKYREGDTLENGAVIEEILPHGLQLYYQGTRFEIEK
jgi:general secretion pathway protein B